MRILIVLPTVYPEKMKLMLHSMELTKSIHSDFVSWSYGTVTHAINHIFKSNPNYDFYMIINDDIEFKTLLWDSKLAKKGKITWGNDLFQGDNLCTFPMIDGDIARALGWLQCPRINRYYGDMVWKEIGKQLGILEYIPEVVIEHKWEGVSHPGDNKDDRLAYVKWLAYESYYDINRVREVLNGK